MVEAMDAGQGYKSKARREGETRREKLSMWHGSRVARMRETLKRNKKLSILLKELREGNFNSTGSSSPMLH